MKKDIDTLRNEAVTASYHARDLAIIAEQAKTAATNALVKAWDLEALYEMQCEKEGHPFERIELR